MAEKLGNALGWVIVTALVALGYWAIWGFVAWDWDVRGWSSFFRLLYAGFVVFTMVGIVNETFKTENEG